MKIVDEATTPVFAVAFTDENDDPVTPLAAWWRLEDVSSGDLITDDTIITTLSTSVDITLSEFETTIMDKTQFFETKRLKVEWNFGSGKAGRTEFLFRVKNMRGGEIEATT